MGLMLNPQLDFPNINQYVWSGKMSCASRHGTNACGRKYAQGFYHDLLNLRHKDGAHGLSRRSADISHTCCQPASPPCGNRCKNLKICASCQIYALYRITRLLYPEGVQKPRLLGIVQFLQAFRRLGSLTLSYSQQLLSSLDLL